MQAEHDQNVDIHGFPASFLAFNIASAMRYEMRPTPNRYSSPSSSEIDNRRACNAALANSSRREILVSIFHAGSVTSFPMFLPFCGHNRPTLDLYDATPRDTGVLGLLPRAQSPFKLLAPAVGMTKPAQYANMSHAPLIRQPHSLHFRLLFCLTSRAHQAYNAAV